MGLWVFISMGVLSCLHVSMYISTKRALYSSVMLTQSSWPVLQWFDCPSPTRVTHSNLVYWQISTYRVFKQTTNHQPPFRDQQNACKCGQASGCAMLYFSLALHYAALALGSVLCAVSLSCRRPAASTRASAGVETCWLWILCELSPRWSVTSSCYLLALDAYTPRLSLPSKHSSSTFSLQTHTLAAISGAQLQLSANGELGNPGLFVSHQKARLFFLIS